MSGSASATHRSAAFRDWLADALRRALDGLNEAWGTAFWSQVYGDWAEIEPPRRTPTFINPSQQLDWRRFSSDSWRRLLPRPGGHPARGHARRPGDHQLHGLSQARRLLGAGARTRTSSPTTATPDTSEPDWMIESGMACDLMRSLGGGRPWMLMEQATGNVKWRPAQRHQGPGRHAPGQPPGGRAGRRRRSCSSSGARREPAASSSTARCSPTPDPDPAPGAR